MASGAFLKTSFNAGELSPLLDGRSDLAKYPQGCSLLENFIPTVQGPIYHRPGTQFVEALDSDAVLVPFVYNRTQTYILAIGSASGIAVYSNRGRVLDGDDEPYFFGSGTWDTPPRREDGTSRLSCTQSGDVLFVCDAGGGLPIMEVKRIGHANWTIGSLEFTNPPPSEFEESLCCLYKKKHDGTTAPDGQFYLAVGIGKITEASFAKVGGGVGLESNCVESMSLDIKNTSEMFFRSRMFGKVCIDLSSRVGADFIWSPNDSGDFPYAPNSGRVAKWTSGTGYRKGGCVINDGRLYAAGNARISYPPTWESKSKDEPSKLFYMGNGIIWFDILEANIDDVIFDSYGVSYPIKSALVKMSKCPENEFRDPSFLEVDERLPNEYMLAPELGASYIRRRLEATTHIKCGAWASATIRDFIPPFMVTYPPLLGELPNKATIFRERLVISVNRNIHMSVAGDFQNFSGLDGSGQVVADCALNLDLLAGDLSPISWMASSDRLFLGSFGGERSIGEQNISNAFGPTNVRVDVSSANGSVDVSPVQVGRDVLMLNRTGRRLIRTALTQDGQAAADLSAMADHIGLTSPFVAMAWRESPIPVLWLASAAGELVGCTFDASQDVASWHRHNIGGLVRDLASIPSPDGTRDDLWLVVERVVDGETAYYLELMPDDYLLGLLVTGSKYLDSSISYDGAPASIFSGLDHLEGETVWAVADGFVLGPFLVASGSVTLPDEYSEVSIGLSHPARVRTMRMHLGADDGVTVGKTVRVKKATVRLLDTVNIRAGWRFDDIVRMDFRSGAQSMDVAVPGQSEERSWHFKGGYDENGYVCLEQDQPLPATIVSLAIEFEVN